MVAVVRKGLAKRRLEVVEDSVMGEHRGRLNDEDEDSVCESEVVVFKAGGWLATKPMAEDLEGS
jgi:hypothetical protein